MAHTLTVAREPVAREDIEAFNAADWDHLRELYSDDAVYFDMLGMLEQPQAK